jgi:hypothetical protein
MAPNGGKMTESPPDQKVVVQQEEPASISFAEFLASKSPGRMTDIVDLFGWKSPPGTGRPFRVVQTPEFTLHCVHEGCKGPRFFGIVRGHSDVSLADNSWKDFYLTYVCQNCRLTRKIFALRANATESAMSGRCYKYGEIPAFGPPTPARLISLIGPDRDIFLKGRTSENQGLGIGAFGYYRRVVENQRDRIIDAIISAAAKLPGSESAIITLSKAKAENQFKKSMEMTKDAMPTALLIDGRNPLTLLHTALSDGLHEQTDEKCLELAHDVRVVLTALVERLAEISRDDAELANAVSRLANPTIGKTPAGGG